MYTYPEVAVTVGGNAEELVLPIPTFEIGWSPTKTSWTWYRPALVNLSIPEEALKAETEATA